jgi:hypothetical protein
MTRQELPGTTNMEKPTPGGVEYLKLRKNSWKMQRYIKINAEIHSIVKLVFKVIQR